MIKILIPVFLMAIASLVFGQTRPKQDDDEFLNPAPNVENGKKKEKHQTPDPQMGRSYYGGKVKDRQPIPLLNYEEGGFNHKDVFQFCKMIIDQIDNVEREKNKIISVSIKGFADGLKNNGVRVSKDQVHPECTKFANFDKGINDIELATLRACEIEGMLKTLLKGKSYFVFVNLTKSYYDVPDGGDSGGSFRKVEVWISYLDRK